MEILKKQKKESLPRGRQGLQERSKNREILEKAGEAVDRARNAEVLERFNNICSAKAEIVEERFTELEAEGGDVVDSRIFFHKGRELLSCKHGTYANDAPDEQRSTDSTYKTPSSRNNTGVHKGADFLRTGANSFEKFFCGFALGQDSILCCGEVVTNRVAESLGADVVCHVFFPPCSRF